MPKCVICYDMLPPELMVPVVTAVDDDVTQCIFCERGIKEVTLEKDNRVEKYTKDQAKRDYIKLLNEISSKQKIAEILAKKKK